MTDKLVEDKLVIETDVKTMREIAQLLTLVGNEECRLSVSKDIISTECVDAGHVAMNAIQIKSKVFESIKCPDVFELGVNAEIWLQKLKGFRDSDKLVYSVKQDDIQRFTVTSPYFIAERDFVLINIDTITKPKVPTLAVESCGLFPGRALSEAIKLFKDEYVVFEVVDDKFTISTKSDSNVDLVRFKLAEPKKSMRAGYTVEYLVRILKGLRKYELQILFATDYPLRINYELDDYINGMVMLAPRIEND